MGAKQQLYTVITAAILLIEYGSNVLKVCSPTMMKSEISMMAMRSHTI